MNTETEDIEDNNSGAKQPSEDSPAEGVTVPEEFQAKVHQLVHKATKPHLAHMRSRISDREDEMRKEEMSKKDKDKVPSTYSDAEMPS